MSRDMGVALITASAFACMRHRDREEIR